MRPRRKRSIFRRRARSAAAVGPAHPEPLPKGAAEAGRLSVGQFVIRLISPPLEPEAAPTLTAEAIRKRRRKAKRAAKAAEPKPEAKPRGRLRDLIGGATPDAGKPAKSQREKEAARDAEFRRIHGRAPRVLVRVTDGPRVLYTDTTAPAPDPNTTYWHGADGTHEEWKT